MNSHVLEIPQYVKLSSGRLIEHRLSNDCRYQYAHAVGKAPLSEEEWDEYREVMRKVRAARTPVALSD